MQVIYANAILLHYPRDYVSLTMIGTTCDTYKLGKAINGYNSRSNKLRTINGRWWN